MLNAQDYLELVRKRGTEAKELERIYHNLQRPDLFLLAYGKLYANQGAMTTGTNPNDAIDGMSVERINQIIQSLKDGTFRWSSSRRIYLSKANGKRRPLGIPNWSDKLVQEAIRLILEAFYEPRFKDSSHGFRPNRGCHTALERIKREWSGTNWFIEGDIRGCFDTIDHEKLLGIMERDIKDAKFLKLMREMLKAGYIENWKYQGTYSGTPQGSVISPLLANIYLNDLDKYIEAELLPKYNQGDKSTRKANPAYTAIERKARKARTNKQWEEAEELGKKQRAVQYRLPSPNYRRLKYIRYADDFVLGFVGPKKEAQTIKEEIGNYLRENLKLDLSAEKTKITHAASERARFLGYELSVAWNNGQRTNGQRSINGRVMLRVPYDVRQTWIRKYQKNGKPIHNAREILNSDYDIVAKYESEVRGLTNYYTLAINVAKLRDVERAAEQSLVKTLANKHKQRTTWVYQKYKAVSPAGLKCLEVKIEREGKKPLLARFGGRPLRYKRFAEIEDKIRRFQVASTRTQLVQRLMADQCENCGSQDRVQVHHIRSIKTVIQKYRKRGTEMPWWIKHMAEAYRKTIVVCHACHVAITNGEYDGRKLS